MKNYRFSQRWFFINSLFIGEIRKIDMTPPCSPRRAGSNHVLFDLERSIWEYDLESGQDQIGTQLGQHAHPPKRLDEPSCLEPFALLCLHPVATYWRNRIVTSFDLRWPPCVLQGSGSAETRICTDRVNGHDPERIGLFRSVYAKREIFPYFPTGL